MGAIHIDQNGDGMALNIQWFTCLDCGWQFLIANEDTATKCFSCKGTNVKQRHENEAFFQERHAQLMEERKSPADQRWSSGIAKALSV
ncbi:hypothetical protein LCGC14_1018380, partial [marine sediment metagenome]